MFVNKIRTMQSSGETMNIKSPITEIEKLGAFVSIGDIESALGIW